MNIQRPLNESILANKSSQQYQPATAGFIGAIIDVNISEQISDFGMHEQRPRGALNEFLQILLVIWSLIQPRTYQSWFVEVAAWQSCSGGLGGSFYRCNSRLRAEERHRALTDKRRCGYVQPQFRLHLSQCKRAIFSSSCSNMAVADFTVCTEKSCSIGHCLLSCNPD